jgi:hypothetical protein
MRRHRRRRRAGLLSVRLDIRESEFKALISRRLLDPIAHHDSDEIGAALGLFLDESLR